MQVLGVKPKNKQCSMCLIGHDSTDHPRARDHVDSSGSMEADIINELFDESMTCTIQNILQMGIAGLQMPF